MRKFRLVLPLFLVVLMTVEASAQKTGVPRGHAPTYRQWHSRYRQENARNHSRLLYHYGRTQKTVPQAVVKQHTDAIRNDVNAAKKAYANIRADAPKSKDFQEHLNKIQKIHA